MENPFFNITNRDYSRESTIENSEKNKKLNLSEITRKEAKSPWYDNESIVKPEFTDVIAKLEEVKTIKKLEKGRFSGFLGIIDIETNKEEFIKYKNFIGELERLKSEDKIHWIENGIKNIIDGNLVNQMNRYWLTIQKLKKVTENEIIKFTYYNHPSKIKNIELKRLIEARLEDVVKNYLQKESNLDKIKNYYLKQLMWIEEIVPNLEKNNGELRNLVIEGKVGRDTSEFIRILREVGFEIVYINLEKEQMKLHDGLFKNHVLSRTITYDLIGEGHVSLSRLENRIKKYELEESKKIKTVARQASEELHEILHGDGSGIIKPWQFENYEVRVSSLKSTYEEIYILWEETASMRSGFKVINGVVTVPSFFTKISGIPEDEEKYWLDYDSLVSSKNTKVIKSLPFMREIGEGHRNLRYGKEGFELNEVKSLNTYKYGYLRESIQDIIIKRMNDLIEDENILKLKRDGMSRKYQILEVCLNIPEEYLEMLQRFDFGQEIPKIVIYLNGKTELNETEGILISLLHLIGFDIVFLVPSGYRLVEGVINDDYIEEHKLSKFIMDLEVPVIRENVQVEEVQLGFWERLKNKLK